MKDKDKVYETKPPVKKSYQPEAAPKEEKKKKSSSKNFNIDYFMSNSSDVRKAGKYLEVGFREWFRKKCLKDKKTPALQQLSESEWKKEFEKFLNS